MALRLATVKQPPKRRKSSTPPPKQEPTSKPEVLPCDKEVKYDPHLGHEVEVDENRPRNKYPSSPIDTRVAKCVYCERIKDKSHMRCIGQNYHEVGSPRYVWACKGCYLGSPTWLQHFAHKSRFGVLFKKNGTPVAHTEESAKAAGRKIVEARREQIEGDIVKALSKHKKRRVEKNRAKFVEKFAKKKSKAVEVLNSLKEATEKHHGKGVSVELRAKTSRGTVVVARAEEGGDEKRVRTVPRWKRKGRSASIRRGRG